MRTPRSGNERIDDSIIFSNNFWKRKAKGKLFKNGHTGNVLGILCPFQQLFVLLKLGHDKNIVNSTPIIFSKKSSSRLTRQMGSCFLVDRLGKKSTNFSNCIFTGDPMTSKALSILSEAKGRSSNIITISNI